MQCLKSLVQIELLPSHQIRLIRLIRLMVTGICGFNHRCTGAVLHTSHNTGTDLSGKVSNHTGDRCDLPMSWDSRSNVFDPPTAELPHNPVWSGLPLLVIRYDTGLGRGGEEGASILKSGYASAVKRGNRDMIG